MRPVFEDHCKGCGKKKVQCRWCSSYYLLEEEEQHNKSCPDKCTKCDLCEKDIKDEVIKDHQLECMFKEMLILRASQQKLIIQNEKLKVRVSDLEMEL